MHDLVPLHNVVRILWNYTDDSFLFHFLDSSTFINPRFINPADLRKVNIIYCLPTFPCLIFPFILPYYKDYNITFIIIQFMDVFNVDKMVTKLVESKWGFGWHLMFLFHYKSHASKSQNYTVFHSINRLRLDKCCLLITNKV